MCKKLILSSILCLHIVALCGQNKLYQGTIGRDSIFWGKRSEQSGINGCFFYTQKPIRYNFSGKEQNGGLVLYDIRMCSDTVGVFRLKETNKRMLKGHYSDNDGRSWKVCLQEIAPKSESPHSFSSDPDSFDNEILLLQIQYVNTKPYHEEWFGERKIVWLKEEYSEVYSFRICSGFPVDDIRYLNEHIKGLYDSWLCQYYYAVTGSGGEMIFNLSLEYLNDYLLSYVASSSHIIPGMLEYSYTPYAEIIDITNRKVLELHDMLYFGKMAEEESYTNSEEDCIKGILGLLLELYGDDKHSVDLFSFVDLWSSPTYYISEDGLHITTGSAEHDYYLIPYEVLDSYIQPSIRGKLKFWNDNE